MNAKLPERLESYGTMIVGRDGTRYVNVAQMSSPRGPNAVMHEPLSLGDPDFDAACATEAEIIRRYNAHEELKAALREASHYLRYELRDKVDALLARLDAEEGNVQP